MDVDQALAPLPPHAHRLGDALVGLGLQELEGHVLQLPLDPADAQAVGERRVDLHRLPGDALLLVQRQVLERGHVVQPVRQLDEQDADVAAHVQEQLAEVLRLGALGALEAQGADLAHAVDEQGHRRVELLAQLIGAESGILDGVVQERGGDGVGAQVQLGAGAGDGEHVDEVGLAGDPPLLGMRGMRAPVGLLDDLRVHLRR